MYKVWILGLVIIVTGCKASHERNELQVKTVLPKQLKEISGITVTGADIWAITDKPHAAFYRLDLKGNITEKITMANTTAVDIEAIASDSTNLYIGDVGDNNGDRPERTILCVNRKSIPLAKEATVQAQQIVFTFPGNTSTGEKKNNRFDCESLMSYKDSLYLFTKNREDDETSLYALPKTPGSFAARFIDSFNSKGLITDAAVNRQGNEVALIGYHKAHQHPFIYLFSGFSGNDFLSGKHQKIHLTKDDWDWQLEGISYTDNDLVYFSCEGTDQVPATLYGIQRKHLPQLDKKHQSKDEDTKKEKDDESEMSFKGKHLKY